MWGVCGLRGLCGWYGYDSFCLEMNDRLMNGSRLSRLHIAMRWTAARITGRTARRLLNRRGRWCQQINQFISHWIAAAASTSASATPTTTTATASGCGRRKSRQHQIMQSIAHRIAASEIRIGSPIAQTQARTAVQCGLDRRPLRLMRLLRSGGGSSAKRH